MVFKKARLEEVNLRRNHLVKLWVEVEEEFSRFAVGDFNAVLPTEKLFSLKNDI